MKIHVTFRACGRKLYCKLATDETAPWLKRLGWQENIISELTKHNRRYYINSGFFLTPEEAQAWGKEKINEVIRVIETRSPEVPEDYTINL